MAGYRISSSEGTRAPAFGGVADGSIAFPYLRFYDFYYNHVNPAATIPLAPGDNVYFKCGDSFHESALLRVHGTLGNPITYGSYVSPSSPLETAKPILDGAFRAKGWLLGSNIVTDGSIENWTLGIPDDWNVTAPGASTVTQETGEVFFGSSSVKIHLGALNIAGIDQDLSGIKPYTWYRLTYRHFEPYYGANDRVAVRVRRDNGAGGADQFLGADGKWSQSTAYTYGIPASTKGGLWQTEEIMFYTGNEGFTGIHRNDHYNIQFCPYVGGLSNPVSLDCYIDQIVLQEIVDTKENLVQNPFFEDWVDDSDIPESWEFLRTGIGIVEQSTDARFGTNGIKIKVGPGKKKTGVKQNGIYLEAGKTYRCGFFSHRIEEGSTYGAILDLNLVRESDQKYYSSVSGAFGSEYGSIVSAQLPEWGLVYNDVSITESGYYSFRVVYREGTGYEKEVMFIDGVFVQERSWADIVYSNCLPNNEPDPYFLYILGNINGTSLDHAKIQLSGSASQPSCLQWGYDSGTKTLYLNIGCDPNDLEVYVSTLDKGVHSDIRNYQTVNDLVVKRYGEHGIHIDGGTSASPLNPIIERNEVYNVGKNGILFGKRPADPDGISDPWPADEGWTPCDCVAKQNVVKYFARDGKIRIPVLSGGSMTDWNSGYIVPSAGIMIIKGANYSVVPTKTAYVEENDIDGGLPILNYSTGRNGIQVERGPTAYVNKNRVRRADHGIGIICNGAYPGTVGYFQCIFNKVTENGDDGIWVEGSLTPLNCVVYNVIGNIGDNGVDCMNSSGLSIYGNTIFNCENEMITIWGKTGLGDVASAFVLNNIFLDWGTTWKLGTPGKRLGVVIGWNGASPDYGEPKHSVVKNNIIFSRDTLSDTYSYPFHVNQTRKTLAEMQEEYGILQNTLVVNPKLIDPEGNDLRIGGDSPAINSGLDLNTLTDKVIVAGNALMVSEDFSLGQAISDSLIDPDSVWPLAVEGIAQGYQKRSSGEWNIGAFGTSDYMIEIPAGVTIPTDGSLIGLDVYVVNENIQAIWRGRIVSASATKIVVSGWYPMFNAYGCPYGSLIFYIGHIYFYDKTPIYTPQEEAYNKLISELQISTSIPVSSFNMLINAEMNDGSDSFSKIGEVDDDNLRLKLSEGHARNIQLEKAGLVNFKWREKGVTLHVSPKRSRLDRA